MKCDITIAGVTFLGVDLPDGDTPLPPSNATYHVRRSEEGYGTPERRMTMLCGVAWQAHVGWSAEGEHKWFGIDEPWWHRHVNCPACLSWLAVVDLQNVG